MPLRYKQAQHLEHKHRGAITALAFSSQGSFLAIASLDGTLSVWSTTSWRMVYEVAAGNVGCLSILWTSKTEDQLLCGLANGVVVSVHISTQDVTVTGFRAHHNIPVECLSINNGIVATGANSQVSLWHYDKGSWISLGEIEAPPSISTNCHSDIVVTSLCWAQTKYSDKTLLIAYLHHGILFWDAVKSKMVHFFYVKTLVGSMGVSPDGKVLVVSNLETGFDFYHLDDSRRDGSVSHECTGRRVPVEFIHCGNAVLGGSTSGEAHIWDCATRTRLQILEHVDQRPVVSIAAHYKGGSDGPRFMLATGSLADEKSKPGVVIWRPVAEGSEPSNTLVETKRGIEGEKSRLLEGLFVLLIGVLAYAAGSAFGSPAIRNIERL